MPNKKKYTEKLAKQIAELVAEGDHTISEICSLTGISRRVYYKWLEESAQFQSHLTRARAREGKQETESVVCGASRALRMLIQGFYLMTVEEKTEFPDDEEIKTTTVSFTYVPPSTKSIIFLLTNADQDNYRTNVRRHITAKAGSIFRAAGKAGARILTVNEAASYNMGDWLRPKDLNK